MLRVSYLSIAEEYAKDCYFVGGFTTVLLFEPFYSIDVSVVTGKVCSSLFFHYAVHSPTNAFSIARVLPPAMTPLPVMAHPGVITLRCAVASSSGVK